MIANRIAELERKRKMKNRPMRPLIHLIHSDKDLERLIAEDKAFSAKYPNEKMGGVRVIMAGALTKDVN